MSDFYEREKHKYFVTPSAQYGERTPGLFKIEASGTNMVALCAKSYVVYKENDNAIELDKIKFSCKGVQKGEMYKLGDSLRSNEDYDDENVFKNIFSIYKNDLQQRKSETITNRGMKRRNTVFTNYEQKKKCSTSFYCKRLVLSDGIHTVPLQL